VPSWGLSDGESAVWDKLQASRRVRGRAWDGGPLGPTGARERRRTIAAAALVLDDWTDPDSPLPLGLHLAGEQGECYTEWDGTADASGLLLLALERAAGHGGFVAFWQGSTLDFHVFLRHIAPHAVTLGYSVQPIGVGAELRAIILSRAGRQTWLTDVRAMSGCRELALNEWLVAFGQGEQSERTDTLRLFHSLEQFAGICRATLGVNPRATVGGTAVAAFRKTLPAEPLWLRPSPGLVALCRLGQAYRGGWVYGEAYRGPAWKVDCNKLYLWSLAQGVPTRHKVGLCLAHGQERPGIYLARLSGRVPLPVAVPAWSSASGTFVKEAWTHGERLTCLPSAEYPGLRALGATVTPLVGYVQSAGVDLSPFARMLYRIHAQYPRGSAQHITAKYIGNALVGKLGENPERVDLLYREGWPGETWWPYLTWDSKLLPNLWVRRRHQVAAHQRVDAAAVVTARARSHVYEWAAGYLQEGGQIVHVDTDGFILSAPPGAGDALDGATAGEYRLEAYDPEAVVLGAKSYLLDNTVHASGFAAINRRQAEVAFDGGSVVVAQRMLRAPWQDPKVYALGTRTLRRHS